MFNIKNAFKKVFKKKYVPVAYDHKAHFSKADYEKADSCCEDDEFDFTGTHLEDDVEKQLYQDVLVDVKSQPTFAVDNELDDFNIDDLNVSDYSDSDSDSPDPESDKMSKNNLCYMSKETEDDLHRSRSYDNITYNGISDEEFSCPSDKE